MSEIIINSLRKLTDYCKKEGYKGWDPFDGLNSRLFQALPVVPRNRTARLIWIQLFKRSPLNLRRVTGVEKGYNPKALGLFISGYCNLYKKYQNPEFIDLITFFTQKLDEAVSRDYSGDCWGYNFDWQARAFFQPRNTPTVVATSFIANALLDFYEISRDDKLLKSARSSCDFILFDLNRTYDDKGNFAFSYSPLDRTTVYNATLLASRLLSRVFSYTHENELLEAAGKSVRLCCDQQKKDGSWTYGTLDHHQWIDNFHTGYNLECLATYIKYSGETFFNPCLEKGFNFYLKTFFTEEGLSKYYDNATYPIDIHSPAQLIITISRIGKFQELKPVMDKVINWTIDNMQSGEGFFYYQKNKHFMSKIPYIRWSQAWMFYSLSEYLLNDKECNKNDKWSAY